MPRKSLRVISGIHFPLSNSRLFQSNAQFPAYPALGAFQLLPLLPKLLDDIRANLVGFSRDLVRALDALASSVQTVCALEKQHPL